MKHWDFEDLWYASLLLILIIYIVTGISRDAKEELLQIKQQHEIELLEKQIELDSIRLEHDKLHELSWESIDYWIGVFGIDHPEIVKQQIALETGNLSSDICKHNHNLFGMKEPRVRKTTALGTNRNHAYYSSFIDSIKDYKLWQDNMYNGEACYYAFLERVGYAEAKHYTDTLKLI